MNRVEVTLLQHQWDFVCATEPEVMLSGGFGSGKSMALCTKLVQRASVPGARELLCRKTLPSLKKSTLVTLLEGSGDIPAFLQNEGIHYFHNKTEQTIRIVGGGTIIYMGIDDHKKLGSMNLTGAAIDEARELPEVTYKFIQGRLREKVAGLSNQLYFATNSDGPTHHLAKRFGLDGGTKAPTTRVIFAPSKLNPYLPAEYVQTLDDYKGVFHQRYVQGLWVANEGRIYSGFDATIHVDERHGPWTDRILACDFGLSDPFVCLDIRRDEFKRLHIAAEYYDESKSRTMETIGNRVEAMATEFSTNTIVIDPSATPLRGELVKRGLPVRNADNSLEFGIAKTQSRFSLDEAGHPRITIDPSCKNLIREIESYSWAEGRNKPARGPDHSSDALRYGVVFMDSKRGGIALLTGMREKESNEEQSKENVVAKFQRLRDENPDFGFSDRPKRRSYRFF